MCMCMPGREDVGLEGGSESWRAVSKDAVPNSCSFFLLIFLLPPQGRAGPRVCPEAFSWCLSHPESECRGDPVRDFHQVQRGYAICRTTRPLSWVECRGSCPGQGCCQGLRLKRRKFTFECSDGTSFAEEVEKPTKCGCALCA